LRSRGFAADEIHKAALPNLCAATTAAKPLNGFGPKGLTSFPDS
jgi:hypothetical protein